MVFVIKEIMVTPDNEVLFVEEAEAITAKLKMKRLAQYRNSTDAEDTASSTLRRLLRLLKMQRIRMETKLGDIMKFNGQEFQVISSK